MPTDKEFIKSLSEGGYEGFLNAVRDIPQGELSSFSKEILDSEEFQFFFINRLAEVQRNELADSYSKAFEKGYDSKTIFLENMLEKRYEQSLSLNLSYRNPKKERDLNYKLAKFAAENNINPLLFIEKTLFFSRLSSESGEYPEGSGEYPEGFEEFLKKEKNRYNGFQAMAIEGTLESITEQYQSSPTE